MKYTVIVSFNGLQGLMEGVNSQIKDGWKCQGGICVIMGSLSGEKTYYQAMCKGDIHV